MDIYEFKNDLGHSGFENCRVVDANSYSEYNCDDGVLFIGDVDDAPDCLDGLEITSIDLWYNEKAKRIDVTIDVSGVDADVLNELHAWREEQDEDDEDYERSWGPKDDESEGLPLDGSKPQLATSDLEPGQWLE